MTRKFARIKKKKKNYRNRNYTLSAYIIGTKTILIRGKKSKKKKNAKRIGKFQQHDREFASRAKQLIIIILNFEEVNSSLEATREFING